MSGYGGTSNFGCNYCGCYVCECIPEEEDCSDMCHHGVGFDEDCEHCEFEIAEEKWLERKERERQRDWIGWEQSHV